LLFYTKQIKVLLSLGVYKPLFFLPASSIKYHRSSKSLCGWAVGRTCSVGHSAA